MLAEAQTDDLIKEAPKPALDQSGEWQETGGEIQWVANDNASDKQEEAKKKNNDEEDEQLDLNKGRAELWFTLWTELSRIVLNKTSRFLPCSSAARREAHGGQHRSLVHSTAAGLPVSGEPGESLCVAPHIPLTEVQFL